MDKIRCGNRGGWIAQLGVLFSSLVVITAQPGFLSISCGGITNHTAKNNITWVADAHYIDVGQSVNTGDTSAYGSYLHTLRVFPKPLNKSCYKLPVKPDVPYLVRLLFAIGNYTGFPTLPRFSFSIETVDMLYVQDGTARSRDAYYHEYKLVTSGTVLYICLIRTFDLDDPFISAIELRTFQPGMYEQAKRGTIMWLGIYNVGGNSVVRYPHDKFDRIWRSDTSKLYLYRQDLDSIRLVSSQEAISTNNTNELPPVAVLQTAWVGQGTDSISFAVPTSSGIKLLLLLYFAEIEMLNMSESRSFYVQMNSKIPSQTITLFPNYSAVELTLEPDQLDYFNIVKAPNSTRLPILNACEYHWLYDTARATYSQDIYALEAIKRSFDIKEWVSDPCYLINWKGIGCDRRSSSAIRISELDLSGRNLTGSVPNDIGHLTALVNVSLDKNQLSGSLPNFSNLTMLERLYLQNNNMNGSVPEWLSDLKNLKELNIENNNFSGVIPAQILHNCSLKFSYLGNPYLLVDLRECTPQISNHSNKLKVVLGITLGGMLIIALAAAI